MTHYMPGQADVPACGIDELAALPDHPVVIRDFRPGLDCGSIEDLLAAAGSPVISGSRDGDICEYFELPSDEVARQHRDRALIEAIGAALPIWNLNSVAEFAMESLLKHRDSLRDSITRTIADRADFSQRLARLRIVERVCPSGGSGLPQVRPAAGRIHTYM